MSSIKKLKEVKPVTEEISNGFNQLFSENQNLDNWVGQFDILSSHLGVADKSFQEFLSTTQKSGTVYKTSEEALAGYQAYLKTTGTATTLATVKTKALSASMKVLSSIGWMVAITAVTEVLSAVVTSIQDAIVTTEEYVDSQNDIISKADKTIEKNNEEISSLESLQKQLELAKGNKVELSAIQSSLNKAIGDTPGLINGEASAYDKANNALKSRIEYYKKLNELELDKKVQANKNIYENNGVNGSLSSGVKQFFFGNILENIKNDLNGEYNTFTFKQYDEYIQDWEKENGGNFVQAVKEATDKNNTAFSEEALILLEGVVDNFIPSKADFDEMLNTQLESLQAYFQDYIDNYNGVFDQNMINSVLQDMVYSGTKLDDVKEQLKTFFNDSDLQQTISLYTSSLSSDSTLDSDKLYNDIKDYFDGLKESNPFAIKEIDAFFDSIINKVKSNVADAKKEALKYSPSDIFSLKDSSNNDTDLGKLNSQVDQIQQAYQTLYDIQEGYSENKSIDIDQLQSLLSLGDDFLDYLVDEDGNLKMDTKSMQDLTAARLLEMKAKVQQGIIDNATNINDEASANDYLKTTNYALADSIQEVTKAKLDEWKTEALAKGEISTPTIDSVYNKAVADLQKTEDLFNNIDLSPTSFGASSTSAFSKQIDFLKTRLTELDELTNKVSASMDNMVGSASKNNLVDAMFAINGNRKETLEKGIKLYQDEASKALAKIPAEYRDMAINGSITLGTFEGKGNEDVVQAIEDYRTWSEKVASTTEEIEKLTTAMRQLQVDKFNNIADDYSALTDLISSNTTLLESQISLLETKGQKVGKSYYTSLIEQNSTYIDILKQERKSLNNQMSSAMANGVKYASEEWQDMYTKIQDVDNSIIEATNSVQEYTNALRDVDVSVFNDITSAISGIKDELSNIIDVLNTEDNVLGDFGGFSADAITSIALYKQQMEASQYEIARTQKEIAKLNDEYANGEWGIQDYTERLQELEEQSWSNVDAYESAKDAILELAKSRVDEEIEAIEESTSAYEDYISKLKDALDAEKKLHDYKKSIEEKQSELTDIQNQINSRLGSDDAATLAEIEKLQSEYAKKVSEIQDLQYDKSIEDQQDALDKQLEDYKKTQENKKTELEKSLEDTEEIITKTIESVLSNASTVSSKLAEVTKKYGINISKNITDPWKSGNNAISGYQTQLTTSTSVFNTKLDGVSNHIRNLQVTADTMAYQMTKDFNSVSGETLNSTLSRVQSYLAYCSTSSVYLKDQIYNALNQSYSSKGIVDTFTNVKNSIDNATNSLRNYIDLTRQKNQQKYKLVQTINGINGTQRTTVVRTGVTEAEAYANNISFSPTSQQGATWYKLVAMAKGGVVKKDNEPSTVARSLGEDTLVAAKYGEGVFTKEQTNALLDLAPTLPDFAKYLPTFDISKFVNNVPRINSMPIVNINYDNLISIDGGTITKDSIPDLQELTKNVANNVSQQLAKDLKNNKGWTTNACRPY